MQIQFYTCDVFTDQRFGGNPLAVVPNADGLTDDQMQKIAREFNYSETTFVFSPEQGHTRKVRIFTPMTEVPFAGHPNIGTAFVLAECGYLGEIAPQVDQRQEVEIVFEEEAGLVPIRIRKTAGEALWCELKAPQSVQIGKTVAVETVARALSLTPDDIVGTAHPPQVASVGLPFLMVELGSKEALERIQVQTNVLYEIEALGVVPDIHVYVKGDDQFDLYTRMFAPLDNVPEDPATGSANCALVGMLSLLDSRTDGQFNWHIAQGFEMGRPSILDARTEKRDGTVSGVWIAGQAVLISKGEMYLK